MRAPEKAMTKQAEGKPIEPVAVSRRAFLRLGAAGAGLSVAALSGRASVVAKAAVGPQIAGVGRITDNIPGVTIVSPSDFGFTADPTGGTFVCSMFGPETGGFRACVIMAVQGIVTPGSLAITPGGAVFSGTADIFAYPDVFTPNPTENLIVTNVNYNVAVTFGRAGKGTMILNVPAVTAALGGDTGGVVDFGAIKRVRVR